MAYKQLQIKFRKTEMKKKKHNYDFLTSKFILNETESDFVLSRV